MIADFFKLKKHSWHMSMMTYIWGYKYYDFSNMCPYFWLSILNVFIIPVIALWKKILRPILGYMASVLEVILKWYDAKCKAEEEAWAIKLTARMDRPIEELDQEIKDYYYKWNFDGQKVPAKYWKVFRTVSKERLASLEKASDLMRAEHWKRVEAEADLLEAPNNRKEIGKMTVQVQYGAKAVGIAIVLTALYWLAKLAKIIWVWVIQANWGVIFITFLKTIGIIVLVILAAGLVIGFVYLLIKTVKFLWCRYGAYCIPCENRRKNFGDRTLSILRLIAQPLIWLARGTKQLWILVVALKQNNCPAIHWED